MKASKVSATLFVAVILAMAQGSNAAEAWSDNADRLGRRLRAAAQAPSAEITRVSVPRATPRGPSTEAVSAGASFSSVAAAVTSTPELSTLAELATAVGLGSILSDPNLKATVLAPTNAAFTKLADAVGVTLDQLAANQNLVKVILSYHLIPDNALKASQLSNGQQLTTADPGETVAVNKSGNSVTFDPTGAGAPRADVVVADITAGSAVVHVIDEVLVPANANLPLAGRGTRIIAGAPPRAESG